MTFDEYINNPMGKANAVFSQRFMFKELYTAKFDALLARDAGMLKYVLYKESKSKYIAHFSIPSEKVPRFYYDVVVEFSTDDPEIMAATTLKDYTVKFFSNDPAFVFTFAHAFKTSGMFMSSLSSKMNDMALKELGKEKNPQDLVGYVKTIYFAYLYYKMKGLDKKALWSNASNAGKTTLLGAVMSADKKVELRQRLGEEQSKKERAIKNANKPPRKISHPVAKSRSSNAVTMTKHIRRSSTTRHSSTVKRK